MMADILKGNRMLAMPRLQDGFEGNYYGRPPIHPICGAGTVVEDAKLADGRYNVLVAGVARVRVLEELASEPYRRARVELLPDADPEPPEALTAWHGQLLSLCRRLAPYVSLRGQSLQDLVREGSDAAAFANRISAALIADPNERQRLLEELDPSRRAAALVEQLQELLSAVESDAPTRTFDLN
jgi:Lon protease-like protein